MTEMTIEVRDSLAPQIQSFGVWLSTLVELAAVNFKTSAPQKASAELIDFLSSNPTPPEVMKYFLSATHQERLDYLLDLNGEGEIDDEQKRGLSEWTKLNHITILLKAQTAKLMKGQSR